MKKSITKKKATTSRKRPKSVMRKAWETRRAKLAAAAGYMPPEALKQAAQEATNQLRSRMLDGLSPDTKTSETETHRSEVNGPYLNPDAIDRTNERHRDEQLLAFMGDLAAARQSGNCNGHYPWLVSRPQIGAIEDFLSLHGYSAWGKGSGALMSVSTKPTTA